MRQLVAMYEQLWIAAVEDDYARHGQSRAKVRETLDMREESERLTEGEIKWFLENKLYERYQ